MLKNKIIISCNCGCGNTIMFNELDKLIYVDFLSADFYSYQNIINFPYKLFISGQKVIKELVVSEEALISLLNYLKSADLTETESKNYSHITITTDKYGDLYLILQSDLRVRDIFTKKYHRAFEIAIGKKEKEKLISQINRALKIKKLLKNSEREK